MNPTTAAAVTELVQCAYAMFKGEGVTGAIILRGKLLEKQSDSDKMETVRKGIASANSDLTISTVEVFNMADKSLPDFTPNIIRFWSKVAVTADDTRCWEWIASRQIERGGYGQFHAHGKVWRSHRYAWLLFYGRMPQGHLCHICDNPPCVNPNHLFEGTSRDNIIDMVKKNRFRVDAANPLTPRQKLTVEQVKEIKERFAAGGITMKRLAKDYGVFPSTVQDIMSGRTWDYV